MMTVAEIQAHIFNDAHINLSALARTVGMARSFLHEAVNPQHERKFSPTTAFKCLCALAKNGCVINEKLCELDTATNTVSVTKLSGMAIPIEKRQIISNEFNLVAL